MSKELIKKKIKEISTNSFKKLVALWVTVTTLYGVLTSFLYDIVSKVSIFSSEKKINRLMYLILIIGIIIIVIDSIREVLKKEAVIKVKTDRETNITIKVGNYENNMETLITDIQNTDRDAVFVIGINNEVNGTRAQKRGVHKAIIDKFYNSEEMFKSFQRKTVKAFNNVDFTKNNFGEVGFVKHNENSKIMFVINSKNSEEQNKSIVGPNPTDIIKRIFKSLESEQVDIVQMPIISSKNVVCIGDEKIRFSIIIVEIIEEYFKQLLNDKNINYRLILSIREEDLKDNSITLGEIVRFIENLKHMYHIK